MSGGVVTYTISGTVYESDGSTAVQGATIALGSYTATSAANGTYTISGIPAGTSGSMTCTKATYTWSAISISAMSGNLTSQNYTATAYDYDFSGMSNGALPAGLSGSTWAIASGQAANSPTLGSELLTDGGLEATYTAGLCGTLSKGGSPALAESADVHGGSKAQEFTATAANDYLAFSAIGSLTGKWLQVSAWGKRTAGTNSKAYLQRAHNQFPGGFEPKRIWNDASYAQKITVGRAYAASLTQYAVVNGAGPAYDTVILDDFSVKEITAAEMYATKTFGATQALKLYIGTPTGYNGCVGLAARMDSASNPQTYILVGLEVHSAGGGAAEFGYLSMAKVVSGTLTALIAPTSIGALPANGDTIELVCSSNDISMYYNGTQVGTTQTVADGNTNTIAGFFGAGGALVNRFFVAASR